MYWQIIATTFTTIFIAEMGDKTQLATFTMASNAPSKWPVFFGAALALVATTALGVLAGDLVSHYIPSDWMKRGAGALFIAMGVIYIKQSF